MNSHAVINRSSHLPLYRQLVEILTAQIAAGDLRQGQRIPSETELSERYRMNRHTVRQAVDELVRTGRLYRDRGRGTFVSSSPEAPLVYQVAPYTRFTHTVLASGGSPRSVLVRALVEPAPAHVLPLLGLAPGEPVYRIETVRFADGQAVGFGSAWLHAARFPDLLPRLQPFRSLYAVLEGFYPVQPMRMRTWFRTGFAEPQVAELLGIPTTLPMLVVQSLTGDAGRTPFEVTITQFRGDRIEAAVDFPQNEPEAAVFPQNEPGVSPEFTQNHVGASRLLNQAP